MQPFSKVKSHFIPLDMDHVDTDMIIPAQYLTKIDQGGYGQYLFIRLRERDKNFVFNDPIYQNAEILLTKANFGCGSSREHAVWALMQAGIKVIIAESYSDIFYNNATQNGLLVVTLKAEEINKLRQQNLVLTVDLASQTISTSTGDVIFFTFDPFLKECFLKGQDYLDYLLEATA